MSSLSAKRQNTLHQAGETIHPSLIKRLEKLAYEHYKPYMVKSTVTMHQVNERIKEVNSEIKDLLYPGGAPNKSTPIGLQKTKYDELTSELSMLKALKKRMFNLSIVEHGIK